MNLAVRQKKSTPKYNLKINLFWRLVCQVLLGIKTKVKLTKQNLLRFNKYKKSFNVTILGRSVRLDPEHLHQEVRQPTATARQGAG